MNRLTHMLCLISLSFFSVFLPEVLLQVHLLHSNSLFAALLCWLVDWVWLLWTSDKDKVRSPPWDRQYFPFFILSIFILFLLSTQVKVLVLHVTLTVYTIFKCSQPYFLLLLVFIIAYRIWIIFSIFGSAACHHSAVTSQNDFHSATFMVHTLLHFTPDLALLSLFLLNFMWCKFQVISCFWLWYYLRKRVMSHFS